MIGKTVLHYKILEKLGEGGMGVVYLADDMKLDRKVALKFLPDHLSADKEALERLLNEARSASALNHPNVCIIHSIEEFKDELSGTQEQFIAMEYVAGTTLRKKNEECPQKITDSLTYAIQIAEALGEAHKKGIAHLDIKSDNIMINSQNQVKVMDFGIAKLRETAAVPRYESTYGTAAYMSPEQAIGKPAGFASDIWSFGVVFYEMLTGKLPFIHNYEAAIIYSILNEPPVPPSEVRSDIPQKLENLILKCLQKEETNRYKNFDQIISELNEIKSEIDSKILKEEYGQANKKEERKETEQKHSTIVYMKIENYPEIIELIGQENIVGLLEKYYDIINLTAKKYEGTVNKTETSEAVLYFGLPFTIENSSRKGVQAAVEISGQMDHLVKEENLPVNLKLNIGINTGLVIAGSISSGQKLGYTVIGDTVDVTSNLLDMASNGEILVGPMTFRQTKNIFNFDPFKSFSLKGKRDPIRVYKLKSPKDGAEKNIKPNRLISSEMIGRSNELDRLEYLLLKAINGEGSVVNIVADAGIGKSRLIEEFKKKEVFQRVLLLEGKAVSTDSHVSFHPIISILKQWAQINETDNESQAFSKLENSILNLCPEEADEIISFIAALMGFNLKGIYGERVREVSGDALSKLIQKSVRQLILKGSEARPVVFIIEDLHWSDLSSIDLLQSLFRLAENNKILFIGTLRPNFPDTGDRILSFIKEKYSGFYTEIKLQPLNDEHCQTLLQNLLRMKDLPDKLKSSISRSTEGNPFFIEEVIRSLIDDNIIEAAGDHFQISGTIENIVIPATIKDLLLSRIDKLDESSKNILKTASVIGRYFLFDILFKVTGRTENIEKEIEHLIKLELIKGNSEKHEREYLFQHALIQEAVYETLLSKNRQDLHLKVAAAIEDLFTSRLSDFYEVLAHHFSLAGHREKAEEYLIKAGERTMHNAASNEALNYFREALKLYLEKYGDAVDKKKIFMLEKNIGISFYNRGYFIDSVEHLIKALEADGIKVNRSSGSELFRLVKNLLMISIHIYLPVKKNNIPPKEKDYILFDVLFKLATAYANYNGKKMFYELLNLIRMKMDFALNCEDGFATYSLAGALFAYSGISFSLGKKFIEKANAHARLNGLEEIYNTGYDETIYKCLSGNWKDFKKINEKLLELKLRKGEVIYTIYQIAWALYIIICRGEYDYAEYLIKKGDEISDMYDFDYGKLYMLSFKADLNLNRRNLYKSISYYTEACEMAERLSFNSWILGLSGKRAKAFILLNDFKSAKESLDIAEAALKKEKSLTPMLLSYFTAYKLFYFVRLFENRMNDPLNGKENLELEKEIKKNIKAAVKVSNKVAEIKPEVDRYTGNYYCIKKNYSKVLELYRRSIDFAVHLESLPELARSYVDMGKILSLLNRSFAKGMNSYKNKNSDHYFLEAENIFEKLNLTWDLDELKRIKNLNSEKLVYNQSPIL